MDRRKFFKKTAISAAGISLVSKNKLFAESQESKYFGVNSFIEEHPDAVFIMRTNVDKKTNGTAIYNTAKAFAESVLVEKKADDSGAVPVSNLIAIKPNLTRRYHGRDGYTVEGTMGIVTDVNFVAGFVDRFKEFGVAADKIHLVETNYDEQDLSDGGYIDYVSNAGINLDDYSDGVGGIPEDKIVWKDVVGGSYYKKFPYLYPVSAPNSWLLNIAKLKAHGMGITGCAKNLQGTIAKYYQHHCSSLDADDVPLEDLVVNRKEIIESNYDRHKNVIPRWDRGGNSGGLWMETWSTRCLDNNMTLDVGLHVVEGIYGRDGNFIKGPSLGDNNPDGLATDYMSNVVIFGKNAFYVDIIAHWIAGHEPGNIGLFHLAIERGLSEMLNPMDIDVYDWKTDGSAKLTKLSEFTRTPLKTKYLQKDGENYWHMVDEPYDYTTKIEKKESADLPDDYELSQNYPNPFNPITTIKFSLKKAGHTNLTLYDVRGRKMATLINKPLAAGNHKFVLDANTVIYQLASGTYFYTLKSGSFMETKKMVILK